MDAALWGLLGTIVGALASLGATWLSGLHTLRLQQEVKTQERQELARVFQRENLLALQEALHDAMRLVARSHLEDLAAFRQGTPWGKSYLGDDLSESMRLANRKLWILIERVADDYLRTALKTTSGDHGLVCSAESHLDAEAAFMKAANSTNETLEQIGTALRGLY